MIFLAFVAYYTFCLAFCYRQARTLLAKEQISVSAARLFGQVVVMVSVGFIVVIGAVLRSIWTCTGTWGATIYLGRRERALAQQMIDNDPALREALKKRLAERICTGKYNVVRFDRNKKDGTDGK